MEAQTIQHKQGIQAYSLGFKSQAHVRLSNFNSKQASDLRYRCFSEVCTEGLTIHFQLTYPCKKL